jgi:SAM-dependent methyltransferase
MTSTPSDRLQAVYDRRAEAQYAAPAVLPDPALDRKFDGIWTLVSSYLPCDAFLDAGCGDGRHLAAFAQTGQPPLRLAGTDISARILETARKSTDQSGLDVDYQRANLERLPFDDCSFDLVLCTQVIEHLLDPQAGVRELARVLAPGGKLVLSTDNRHTLSKVLNAPRSAAVRIAHGRNRSQSVSFPHRDFAIRDFEWLVDAAGLTIERVETFRFHLDPPLDSRAKPGLQRALNRLDRALPRHRFGDIVAIVASRPHAATA